MATPIVPFAENLGQKKVKVAPYASVPLKNINN